MTAALVLDQISVTREGTPILRSVCAEVPAGRVTAIIGPNGAGKSTLLSAVLGLVPHTGTAVFHGTAGRPAIGYVPQRLDFDRQAPISVLDFLALKQQRRPLWLGVSARTKDRAVQCLARVQGESLLHQTLGKLSGGELQRVQLALALLNDPDIVFLDEPISGVDMSGEQLFCDLLETVQKSTESRRMTVVMVSHDLEVVAKHASHVVCLKKSVQFAGRPKDVLTEDNLRNAFGPHMGMCRHILEEAPAHGVPVQIEPLRRPDPRPSA